MNGAARMNGKHHGDNAACAASPSSSSTQPWPQPQPQPSYAMKVSWKFVLVGWMLPVAVAYGVGKLVRSQLMEVTRTAVLTEFGVYQNAHSHSHDGGLLLPDAMQSTAPASRGLPSPRMKNDRDVPKTLYSSKNFDTAASASSRSILIEKARSSAADGSLTAAMANTHNAKKKAINKRWQDCPTDVDLEDTTADIPEHCKVSQSSVDMYAHEEEEEEDSEDDGAATIQEDLHLPAGQHLLVDIKEVDGSFLNDEQRLAQAMIDVVWESDLTLLSYHCHRLVPTGVSCVGVLLESHISFHTWPTEGVITLDLFTCGTGLLVPVVPIIERLFGVPQQQQQPVLTADSARKARNAEEEELEPPTMVWAHKLRGFRPLADDDASRPLRHDVGRILGQIDLDMKQQIASVTTKYQQVDIWDVIDPRFQDILSYRKSLSNDGSYEATHPELYTPDRRVYLDGTLQSTLKGNEPYHEALVHPGMFTHANPRRVAIIGGGEGATLREVLKHKSIQHVKMIDIDQGMVETSRDHLPMWNICSDIVGSTISCFDDARADVLCEDALAWFIHRFADDGNITSSSNSGSSNNNEKTLMKKEQKFDVIIMDALDPQDSIPFAEILYSNQVFTKALYNALEDDGLIIMQLGEAPFLEDPADESTKSIHRSSLIKQLENVGFESMHAYSEAHCGFESPWAYLVSCKDYGCRQRWYANPAELNMAIRNRILGTYSGTPALKYFDAAVMQTYQTPEKGFETVFCRQSKLPEECSYLRGYDPFVPNIPGSAFELRKSEKGKKGYGVFTKVDIPKKSMIMQDSSVHAFNFHPSTVQVMHTVSNQPAVGKKALSPIFSYLSEYGFENMLYGNMGFDLPSSLIGLINHGCNGTRNVGTDPSFEMTEFTVDPSRMPESHYPKGYWKDVFNPVVERHLAHLIGGFDVACRDIKAGEEILENYLALVTSEDDWESTVNDLIDKCRDLNAKDS